MLLLTSVLLYLHSYASRVKLITNDAQKNSENKEINRLKAVSSCRFVYCLHDVQLGVVSPNSFFAFIVDNRQAEERRIRG